MADATARIQTDGAARGNPGPAAWAYVIEAPGKPAIEHAERMGEATNNVAEYTALIRALERAAAVGLRDLHVFSDSELMVKQVNGEYAVKNADLRNLHTQVGALLRKFNATQIEHVRRAQNRRADALCNEVLDGRPGASGKPKSPALKRRLKTRRRPDVDAIALECLHNAARSWATTHGQSPAPEFVWDQIWSVLDENGVLKPNR